jgi:hypothetical protein
MGLHRVEHRDEEMMRLRAKWLALCTVTASVAVGQGPLRPAAPHRTRILGVYDPSGDPVEGAQVTDMATGTWAVTTKTGTVSLVFLPEGGNVVRVRKIGYVPWTQFVAISSRDTSPVTIVLSPTLATLAPLVTVDTSPHYFSPGLKAFEERRKTGFGQFITESQLRKSDTHEMPDVLRRLNGVKIVCAKRFPRSCVAQSFTEKNCPLSVYIDGVQMSDVNLLTLPVVDFAGIESYSGPAKLPPQYNRTGNMCGVLLFWTRER